MVHGGMKLIKLLLFLFNFIFWLSGLGLIVFGTIIKIQGTNYMNFLGNSYLAASILLIVAGCIIAVLGFFGCCGAIRENYCMTMTFAVLLGLIFILELAAGIASYVLRSDLERTLKNHITEGMNNYLNETYPPDTYTNGWDYMQQKLNCCGTINQTDWESKEAFKHYSKNNQQLPYSCCQGAERVDICTPNDPMVHTTGCLESLKKFAESKVAIMGGVGCGVAFIQVVGIFLSCCFAAGLKYREARYY